jgi:intein/homing endonuclease
MSLGANIKPRDRGNEEMDPICRALRLVARDGVLPVVACLPRDTLVYTNPGGPKPIAELKPGEYVFAFEGDVEYEPLGYNGRSKVTLKMELKPRRVLAVISNGVRPVYRLRTLTREIEATDNHPFLMLERVVSERFMKVIELYKQGYGYRRIAKALGIPSPTVRYYIRRFKEGKAVYKYRLVWKPLRDIKVGDVIAIVKKLPDVEEKNVQLRPELAYILGFYLGDGYYRERKTKKEINLYVKEDDKAFEKLKTALSALGIHYRYYKKRVTLAIYSEELLNILKEYGFKAGALEKEIPPIIFKLPRELKMKFVEGYLDADGCERMIRNRYGEETVRVWVFESPNEKLMRQLRMLLISMGIRVTRLHKRVRRNIKIFNGYSWYEYPEKTFYWFEAFPESEKRLMKFYRPYVVVHNLPSGLENEYIGFEQVKSIEYVGEKEVFDITVEGAHNFIAEGIIVHNSGNSGQGYASTPGFCSEAITVGAVDRDLKIARFSSRGHPDYVERGKPEIVAPGVYIRATTATGSLIDVMQWMDGVRRASISGTSMSSPHASGVVALWVEYLRGRGVPDRDINVSMVKDIISRYGKPYDPDYGHGVISFEWAVRYYEEVLAG